MTLRVLHVVSLIDAKGSYGGPVAVARQQVAELNAIGVEADLLAGWDGSLIKHQQNAPELLQRSYPIPGAGINGRLSPQALWRTRHLAEHYDLAHVHLGRDLFTAPWARLALAAGLPLVIQSHGMIRSDARVAAKVVDHSMVLPVLRGAKAVLALTAEEEHDIRQQAGTAATVIRLGNGITPTDLRARWATPSPEVIFCSRLHERKRPEAFVEMCSELVSRGLNARFTLVGPDSGSLQPTIDLVRRLGLQGHVTFGGALAPGEVRRRLAAAQVFVLPSFAEPYPMAVLEAVSVGLPAVITHDTGISDLVSNRPGVAVTDGTPTELADAVERFLYDRDHWARASLDAVRLSADVFDARQVTLQLRSVYRR